MTTPNTRDAIQAVRISATNAPAKYLFDEFTSLGGKKGWLYLDWAWKFRGWIDGVIGGVGMRSDLPPLGDVQINAFLDFWVVEQVIPGELLRLRAEMKLPGEGWLEFRAEADSPVHSTLTQTATFIPRGFAGLLYWYLLYPIHSLIFSGMARQISLRAAADYRSHPAR